MRIEDDEELIGSLAAESGGHYEPDAERLLGLAVAYRTPYRGIREMRTTDRRMP